MSTRTAPLHGIPLGDGVASEEVDSMGDGFQVVYVAAGPPPAGVIEFHTLWDGSIEGQVREPVGVLHPFLFAEAEVSISVR